MNEGEDAAPWKHAMSNCPMSIVKVDKNLLNYIRIQERENVAKTFVMLYRSTIGRAFEVINAIELEEERGGHELTAEEASDAWNKNISHSGVGDPVTPDYVKVLLKLKRKVFASGSALNKLLLGR